MNKNRNKCYINCILIVVTSFIVRLFIYIILLPDSLFLFFMNYIVLAIICDSQPIYKKKKIEPMLIKNLSINLKK